MEELKELRFGDNEVALNNNLVKSSILPQSSKELSRNVKIQGGCPGNTVGVSLLTEGRDAREAANLLRGIPCGARGTSCPDQLARAIDAELAALPNPAGT